MGTTRDALDAGSTRFLYTVVIEGYSSILTNGTAAQAIAAYSGTDWTAATPGLFVDLQNEQSISPWEPLHNGGKCVLTVVPTPGDDTFGIVTHRKTAGASTELTATMDRDDTTASVKSTSTFDASGTIHIGTECITYSGVTATSFTGLGRGKFSPFGVAAYAEAFAQHHRVGVDPGSVKLQPVVSEQPRVWAGRWVGVWMHRVVGGVLDVLEEAELVYAGKIVDIRDTATPATVVECKHILDVVQEATVGRQLWNAKTREGIYLQALGNGTGMAFGLKDSVTFEVGGASFTTGMEATPLVVVSGTPANANEIQAGYYTVSQLRSVLNAYWAAEKAAGRILGDYTIDTVDNGLGWRTQIDWYIDNDENFPIQATIIVPERVATFLGCSPATVIPYGTGTYGFYSSGIELVAFFDADSQSGWNSFFGSQPALKSLLMKMSAAQTGLRFEVIDEQGEFVEQYDSMPSELKDTADPTANWGLFIFDDKVLMRGVYVPASAGVAAQLTGCAGINQYGNAFSADLRSYNVLYDGTEGTTLSVRQVLMFEAGFGELLASFLYSTGTTDYNSATYDKLPFGCGAAIPGSLLGGGFLASIGAISGADASMVVIIDKTTKLSDLFDGDLVLRRAFLLWRDGGLRFKSWQSPSTASAGSGGGTTPITLTEANKAEPSGNDVEHRTVSEQTTEWQRPIVKIFYNRDFMNLGSDDFQSVLTLEDRTAIDDAGGDAPTITVKAQNTYDRFAQTGTGVEDLIPAHLATMTMFSRPAHKKTRSVNPTLFHQLAVGDVVLFEDEFSRDPATGLRGISARPALVVRHMWNPGGFTVGSDDPESPGGSVDLFFVDTNAVLSDALYAPSADLDDTADAGGFTSGYDHANATLRCYEHRYNQSAEYWINGSPVAIDEDADATYFDAGYKIKIIEKDPLDAANPLVWEREVLSQSGNDIVLTAALSSPAFDDTKFYRVIFDDFDVATTLQKVKAYQADDADGLVLDSSGPYLYSAGAIDSAYEANIADPGIELPPTSVYQDGSGRDAGHDAALVHLSDNLIDYKTAIQAPMLWNSVLTNSDYSGTYLLVACTPIYMTFEDYTSAVLREYSVAPFFGSSDGSSATCRVTIARSQPSGTYGAGVNRGAIYSETSFTTTSTWVIPSPGTLQARVKSGTRAWLLIECSYKCQTRGLARFIESARTAEFFGV